MGVLNLRKYTFDEVKKEFETRGYKLIEIEYEGQLKKMKFVCPHHSEKETLIRFKQLKRGEGCKYCGMQKQAKSLSLSKVKYIFKEVKETFLKNGCELLSTEYKNTKDKLLYRCKCGVVSKTTYHSYIKGSGRCKSCGLTGKNVTWTHEKVKELFEERGCTLLSKDVKNRKHLEYICKCGTHSHVALGNFLSGQGCKECADNKRRLNYDDVKYFFESEGCTLLTTEYRNTTLQKLDYICKCGNPHSIRFHAFKRGDRCPYCRMVSRGEKAIDQYLRDKNVEYKYQYMDPRCNKNGHMPFDFAVFEKGALKCLIEYDGRLHFVPVELFGGEEYLNTIKENDEFKTQFCKDMNIPLHRIPYKQFKNIESILDEILRREG